MPRIHLHRCRQAIANNQPQTSSLPSTKIYPLWLSPYIPLACVLLVCKFFWAFLFCFLNSQYHFGDGDTEGRLGKALTVSSSWFQALDMAPVAAWYLRARLSCSAPGNNCI